jgi:hypothetical protein
MQLSFSSQKREFAKRTQPRRSHCHRSARISICETNPTLLFPLSQLRQNRDLRKNPTLPFPLSQRRPNFDLRNEPNLAVPTVTPRIEGTNRRNSAIVSSGRAAAASRGCRRLAPRLGAAWEGLNDGGVSRGASGIQSIRTRLHENCLASAERFLAPRIHAENGGT